MAAAGKRGEALKAQGRGGLAAEGIAPIQRMDRRTYRGLRCDARPSLT
jgi:hypothetical protein